MLFWRKKIKVVKIFFFSACSNYRTLEIHVQIIFPRYFKFYFSFSFFVCSWSWMWQKRKEKPAMKPFRITQLSSCTLPTLFSFTWINLGLFCLHPCKANAASREWRFLCLAAAVQQTWWHPVCRRKQEAATTTPFRRVSECPPSSGRTLWRTLWRGARRGSTRRWRGPALVAETLSALALQVMH